MPTILHAEDDAQLAELVNLLFQKELPGAVVKTVPTGKACLAAMEAGGVDLLLDLVLPGKDGLGILSELARRGDPTPVIVLSSHGQYEQTVSALRAGAIDCIDKKGPRFMDIARIVARYLEREPEHKPASVPAQRRQVFLLEHQEQTAVELATILGKECPEVTVRTIPSRTEWDRLVFAQMPCDALVISDQWDLPDLTDIFRDFRTLSRGGPGVLLCRLNRVDVVIAAYALGCRDCIVHRHGYQYELARSLNHLLHGRNRAV